MLYALISHDVDHIKPWEHIFKDLIIEKFIIRSKIEWLTGKIFFAEYLHRIKDVFLNRKWNHIHEVIAFNQTFNVPSTFFVGVNNGMGLNYPLESSIWAINEILKHSFYEIGLHGIAFDNLEKMKKEHVLFKNIAKMDSFGIRMHYLRRNDFTLNYIKQCGYLYDASFPQDTNPYYTNEGLLEIPVHIMDGWMFDGNKRYQIHSLDKAKDLTKKRIDELVNKNVTYISILFHDRYYSNAFISWKKWYEWLITYLIQNKFTFILHKDVDKLLHL